MSLPTPNLDDRNFQQLVDDAKRMVQARCPDWTDHNVSDPGVTLIETFAYMVDQLIYRLNRVPERNYVKFLELIGVRLYPATAARAPVTFWLSTSQAMTIAVPERTVVATQRSEHEMAITYSTVDRLDIVSSTVDRVATQVERGDVVDVTETLALHNGFACFSPQPRPGDCVLFGLSDPVPRCAVELRISATIEGVGVDPAHPPLAWEAWCGGEWKACELDRDSTGGLNRDGALVIHVPSEHQASVIGGERAGWLRARVIDTSHDPDWPEYSVSPRISAVAGDTVGGTVEVTNAELVRDEVLGLSEGVPGQRFALAHQPVVASREPVELEVAAGQGWERWQGVESFADSSPEDRHFILDAVSSEVVFGPTVREGDGSLHAYGGVPPKGAPIRIRNYYFGGGRGGNVSARAISVLRTTVPFVGRVENRVPAAGGIDAESVDAAKIRGPILLRTRNRAVTAEDYEQLAREAAPEVARVRCLAATDQDEAGVVRLLVVPAAAAGADGQLRFEQLVPEEETLARIKAALEERRCVGARLVIEPPRYQGITVVARLRAQRHVHISRLGDDASAALYHYFNPITGGPEGGGWPFGRPVHSGEVYAVLQRLDGCEFVEEVLLFGADPLTGRRGKEAQRIELDGTSLVYSYGHQIQVDEL